LNLDAGRLATMADAGLLEQVLVNLVVNARDAMPLGGHLLVETARRNVGAEQARTNSDASPGHYVWFRVADTGTGIDPQILPRIFEPFFTTKEEGRGTGLGLATVFSIVKQHSGWVQVFSQVNQGSSFEVFLPWKESDEIIPAGEAPPLMPKGGSETILLVEDDAPVRSLAESILRRFGYTVISAADGIEALARWRESRDRISLLLTDVVMPGGISGPELAERLKAEQPSLKIVLASGYSSQIAGRPDALAEDQEFIQKPYSAQQLLAAVRRCLDTAAS
jgi:two-component system cell cycle sensor histidine kinase/response regulator CckA